MCVVEVCVVVVCVVEVCVVEVCVVEVCVDAASSLCCTPCATPCATHTHTGPSQQEVVRSALHVAGMNSTDIMQVQMHGTGTLLGMCVCFSRSRGGACTCGLLVVSARTRFSVQRMHARLLSVCTYACTFCAVCSFLYIRTHTYTQARICKHIHTRIITSTIR